MITMGYNCQRETMSYLSKCEKKNINDIVCMIHSKYLNGLKSSNIGITNDFKYIRAWNTLINTIKNRKNNRKTIIGAVNQLHYTNVINN